VDKETLVTLYQKCPSLWSDFQNVTSCIDAFSAQPRDFEHLANVLLEICNCHKILLRALDRTILKDWFAFICATGFIDQAVLFYRELIQGMDHPYMINFAPPFACRKYKCLVIVREIFLNFSSDSADISTKLIQAGFVKELTDDLKQAIRLSSDELVRILVLFLVFP
jgi:hypothetical protein